MKINNSIYGRPRAAFTLIEMIGVLAVIAILAALLVPKIFNAVDEARVNNLVVGYNTVKTAVMDHYGKYGAFDKTAAGNTIPATGTLSLANYDVQLVNEGFLDKPFASSLKLGSGASVRVITSSLPAYDLAGLGSNDTASASFVVEAFIQGVSSADAKDINDRLDGDKAPFNVALGGADTKGRVKYDGTNVSLYIGHR